MSDLAQASVTEKLKSPSTAVFTETTLRKTADGTKQMIEGGVDSQNGFGAMIRSQYYVTFTCEDGKPVIAMANMEGKTWGPEWQAQMDSLSDAAAAEANEILDRARAEDAALNQSEGK